MAVWIEDAENRIVLSAKKEFLEKGFLDSSIRAIAESANTSPRSIYTRFKDKEDLFSYFVKRHKDRLLEKVRMGLEAIAQEEKTEQIDGRLKESSFLVTYIIEYIYEFYDEFYLLICCAKGTKYEGFIEELTDIETEYTKRYLKIIEKEIKDLPTVTDEFIHIVNRAFFDGMFEIIRHKFTKEKAKEYVENLIVFYNAGWEKFLI